MWVTRGTATCALLIACAAAQPVRAQAVPPGALRPDVPLPETPLPNYAEPAQGVPQIVPPPDSPAPSDASGLVVIDGLAVSGGTSEPGQLVLPEARDAGSGLSLGLSATEAFDAMWLERQFAANGLLHAPVPYARIVAMVQLVNARLAAAGFVNSGVLVPPQPPITDHGVLALVLVVGRIAPGDVALVAPGGGLDARWVKTRLPSLKAAPFNAAAFERDFRLLAEDPAVSLVNADLRPTGRAGEAAVSIAVEAAPRGDFTLGYANSRTPSIGAERASLGGYLRNVLLAGDVLSGEVGRTGGVTDWSLRYDQPLVGSRTRLGVGVSANDALVVDGALAALDIRTESFAANATLSHALVAMPLLPRPGGGFSAARTLTAKLAIDVRDTQTFLLGEPFSFSPGSVRGLSRTYVARAGLDYVVRAIDQVFAASLTGSLGLDGTGSDIVGVPKPDKHFRGLLGQLAYARRMTKGGLELRGRATGQWLSSVGYSSERLPVGGVNSVRGYRETLYLVDNAVIGSVEVSQPVRIGPETSGEAFAPGRFAVSAFVDGAWMDNNRVADPPRRFIAGAGVGLSWNPGAGLSARVSWAHNFQDVAPGGEHNLQDDGVYFAVTLRPLALASALGLDPK